MSQIAARKEGGNFYRETLRYRVGPSGRVGDFAMFFRSFFVFPALGGFTALYEPDGIADCCKKGPCDFNTEMCVSKVGNPCPTVGQLLPAGFVRALGRSCSKVGQLLVNSSPTPHPMGSCRGLPSSSTLATPDVWRVLFRKRELTEFLGKLGEFCEKNSVSSLLHTSNRLRRTH